MLLNTLVNTVKRKSHRGSQNVTTDLITTDIVACANEAIRDIYKLVPKRYFWKQGTVSAVTGVQGTPYTLSLASDVQEPIVFWYVWNPGNTLYYIKKVYSDQEWFGTIWTVSTPPDRPYYFREIGLDPSGYRQIELFPSPSATITINYEYYVKKPVDLTTANLSAEIPVIPDLYHDVIEKGALYYFIKSFDDAAGMVAKADYEQAKLAMEIGDERDQDGLLSLRRDIIKSELPGFRLY